MVVVALAGNAPHRVLKPIAGLRCVVRLSNSDAVLTRIAAEVAVAVAIVTFTRASHLPPNMRTIHIKCNKHNNDNERTANNDQQREPNGIPRPSMLRSPRPASWRQYATRRQQSASPVSAACIFAYRVGRTHRKFGLQRKVGCWCNRSIYCFAVHCTRSAKESGTHIMQTSSIIMIVNLLTRGTRVHVF